MNGAGYTVSYELIEDIVPKQYTRLFRENHGYIYNFNVSGKINVTGGNVYAGLICGRNLGTIKWSQTYYYGYYYDYMITNNYSSSCCGGLTGYNTGSINMVTNNVHIYSIGPKGQIAGLDTGTVENWFGYGILQP